MRMRYSRLSSSTKKERTGADQERGNDFGCAPVSYHCVKDIRRKSVHYCISLFELERK